MIVLCDNEPPASRLIEVRLSAERQAELLGQTAAMLTHTACSLFWLRMLTSESTHV